MYAISLQGEEMKNRHCGSLLCRVRARTPVVRTVLVHSHARGGVSSRATAQTKDGRVALGCSAVCTTTNCLFHDHPCYLRCGIRLGSPTSRKFPECSESDTCKKKWNMSPLSPSEREPPQWGLLVLERLHSTKHPRWGCETSTKYDTKSVL
jgi:hypothetical protein